ncbi:hypothetical protein EVAR_32749_1 [Eumeta japonica]|uniref:Uncharacterized protein n=1 Tax=Eumeta variegata TaxID=151549 RepID=A0A4C1XLD7_EUMVA|nr:hypothetical protein EVAR_32749_1 [Eumeta japonica]
MSTEQERLEKSCYMEVAVGGRVMSCEFVKKAQIRATASGGCTKNRAGEVEGKLLCPQHPRGATSKTDVRPKNAVPDCFAYSTPSTEI